MPPHNGLVHEPERDWRDSNVALINSELDHKIKYQSAATEPAWNNGIIGTTPGLYVWRIENFEVVPWPTDKYGSFHEGDSYIVLHSEELKRSNPDAADPEKLLHDIYFWLGAHTTQDEAGTAAYKTVELDEFLVGAATQHRELQATPSAAFARLFPRLKILRGGVASGFTHVDPDDTPQHTDTLLRVFKHPQAAARDAVVVHEVEPTWRSLDSADVFILDKGDRVLVWQGAACSPMEKLKAAQVVHDIGLAKHVDVEVLAQTDARAKIVVDYLGGEADGVAFNASFSCPRPLSPATQRREKKLFRLSDADGALAFELVKQGNGIAAGDFEGDDVLLFDADSCLWVWEGQGASRAEKAMWLRVSEDYVRRMDAVQMSVAKVRQGYEGRAFWEAVAAA
jgi:gelsolin